MKWVSDETEAFVGVPAINPYLSIYRHPAFFDVLLPWSR
jgi:hypothetical protein